MNNIYKNFFMIAMRLRRQKLVKNKMDDSWASSKTIIELDEEISLTQKVIQGDTAVDEARDVDIR